MESATCNNPTPSIKASLASNLNSIRGQGGLYLRLRVERENDGIESDDADDNPELLVIIINDSSELK